MNVFKKTNKQTLCFVAALFPFYAFFQLTVINAVSDHFIKAFSLTHIGLSSLSSAYIFGDALMLIPAGYILDYCKIRPVILFSFFGIFIFSTAFYFSPTFHFAVSMRFLAGIAHSFGLISALRIATLYLPAKKQSTWFGIILAMTFLGGLFSQSVFTTIAYHAGFTAAAITQTLLGLACGIVIFYTLNVPKKLFGIKKTPPIKVILNTIWQASKNSQNWFAAAFVALTSTPLMVLGALYNTQYLMHYKQYSFMEASHTTSFIFIGITFGSIAIGWLFDHIKSIKPLMITCIACTLIFSTMIFYVAKNLWCMFFLAGFFSSIQNIAYSLVSDTNAKKIISTAMGATNLLLMAFTGILQILAGTLANYFDLETSLMLIIITSISLSSAYIFLAVPKRQFIS